MSFEEAYGGWQSGRLTQEEAARLLGVCERTFRRHIHRYEDEGLEGLIDKWLNQVSHRRAPADEVMKVVDRYHRSRHEGWSAKHFYVWYRRDDGERCYTWVKKRLQEAKLVPKASKRGAHRKRRERSPWRGMMVHQDGSTHDWVSGQHWDLIVTPVLSLSKGWMMPRTNITRCSSSRKKARKAVFEVYGRLLAPIEN